MRIAIKVGLIKANFHQKIVHLYLNLLKVFQTAQKEAEIKMQSKQNRI